MLKNKFKIILASVLIFGALSLSSGTVLGQSIYDSVDDSGSFFQSNDEYGSQNYLDSVFSGTNEEQNAAEEAFNNDPVVRQSGLLFIVNYIRILIGYVTWVIIGLAVVYLLFGLLKYGFSKEPNDQATARKIIVNGIIVLFVMVSVWGLVELLSYSLGLNTVQQDLRILEPDPGYGERFGPNNTNAISTLIYNIAIPLLKSVTGLIVAIAIIYFFFGLAKYGFSSSDSDRKNARGIIANGLIIIFVMVSMWGIVSIISDTVQIGNQKVSGENNVQLDSLIKKEK